MHEQVYKGVGRPPRPVEERFWEKVDKSAECWLWVSAMGPDGYGRFWLGGHTLRAHRVAYEITVGSPIPEGLVLDHLCRNPSCVRPDHLEPVTQRDNILRGEGLAAQNAFKTCCPAGHEYDEANTYRYRGQRFCRECAKLKARRRRALVTV